MNAPLVAQQNAVYTIRLNYEYEVWEDGCESCKTHYWAYPNVGLTSSNGGTIIDVYLTSEETMELTYFETRNYKTYQWYSQVMEDYCNQTLNDDFNGNTTGYCVARKHILNGVVNLGAFFEYGNANSENLHTFGYDQLKSYAKSWLLPHEPSKNISVSYSNILFERQGLQVQDGHWEYMVQGSNIWKPIPDNTIKSLFPLHITAAKLDQAIPENLKNLGGVLLRFQLSAKGSGYYKKFSNAQPTQDIHSEERTIGFYTVTINPDPIALDAMVNPNPVPIDALCSGAKDAGFSITFDRTLTPEEKINFIVHKKIGNNQYEGGVTDYKENLVSSDFTNKTYLFEGANLGAGTYGIKWIVGPKEQDAFPTVESDWVDIIISEPPPINVELNNSNNISCEGGNDGEITITPSGGTPPYSYTWKRNGNAFVLPQGSTNTNLVNLPEGNYTVSLTDSHDCVFGSAEFVVDVDNTSPQLDTHQVFQPGTAPNYLPTGSIVINNIIGGSGNYTLHWQKDGEDFEPQNPNSLNQLEPGIYSLIVEDMVTGCMSEEVDMEIIPLEPLTLQITETLQITCEGDVGILTANPSGGTNGGYQYLWSNGETTPSTEVGQGEYSVTVTDNGDSEVEELYEFDYTNPLLTIAVNKTDVLCKDEATGVIDLEISGGTGGPYTVSWLDTQGGDATRTDLEAGEYVYFVSDGECQVNNEDNPIVIDEPEGFFWVEKISQTNVSLNGENDGILEISLDNGLPPYTFYWTKDGQPYEPTAESTDTHLVGLEAGVYQVVVTDDLGCQATLETPIQISEPDPLAIVEINTVDVNCKGAFTGAITVNVTGIAPFTYTWKKQEDLSFSAPDKNAIHGLSSGTYILTVSDASIVPPVNQVITIMEPAKELTATAIPNITECYLGNEGNIQIYASGGVTPYLYLIDNGMGFQIQPSFDGLEAGTYEVIVVDANQCEYRTSTTLGQPDQSYADFTMSTQALVGENVLAVDLSYPIPDELEWVVPEEAIVLNKTSDELEMVFNQPGEYEVGVLAYKGDCLSSTTKKIIILESNIANEESVDNKAKSIEYFIVYPNPTTGLFNAGIQLSESGTINLKLFGLANNNLILHEQAFGNMNYDIPMDISGLPSGLYVLVLESQFGSSIQKVILN